MPVGPARLSMGCSLREGDCGSNGRTNERSDFDDDDASLAGCMQIAKAREESFGRAGGTIDESRGEERVKLVSREIAPSRHLSSQLASSSVETDLKGTNVKSSFVLNLNSYSMPFA